MAENYKAASLFLDENQKKDGIVTLPTGLQYKVVKKGSGDSPKPTDSVQVQLKGMLLNGAEFFSTHTSNEPATFPLGRVIKGLKEGLLLMKKGDRWTIYIPPELAFGEDGNTPAAPGLPGVGPNELVIYEVELLDVQSTVQE